MIKLNLENEWELSKILDNINTTIRLLKRQSALDKEIK